MTLLFWYNVIILCMCLLWRYHFGTTYLCICYDLTTSIYCIAFRRTFPLDWCICKGRYLSNQFREYKKAKKDGTYDYVPESDVKDCCIVHCPVSRFVQKHSVTKVEKDSDGYDIYPLWNNEILRKNHEDAVRLKEEEASKTSKTILVSAIT